MRENCQSGSMSGNRKQDQAKPDCGDAAKAPSNNHRETTVTAPVLDSTRGYTQNPSMSAIAFYEKVIKVKADVAAFLINCFPSA